MTRRLTSLIKSLLINLKKLLRLIWRKYINYWRKNIWHKLIICLIVLFGLILGIMYGIARWYIASESSRPLTLGVTFIPDYAQSLGLNPQQTMSALINDLHVKNFRLTSYWSDMEPSPGVYNFSQLDWEFQMAEAAHAKVILTLGLRQPRWPECHLPAWADNETVNQWQPQLESYIAAVVNRYKNSPSLASYQLENEYFLKGFGICTNFNRNRLISEYNLVKKLDSKHQVIISRSNNAIGFPIGQPTPDEFSITLYKRVWDTHTHRYFEYPIPAWYYAFIAGVQKIFLGKDMTIDELQAEPWPPHGETIPQSTLAEQNKTMNPAILKSRIAFGKATGMKSIYLWGAEYWYYRMVALHDPSVWNLAKQAFQN